MNGFPYRWFGRDRPAHGWDACPAARPEAWGLRDERTEVAVRGRFATGSALWAALGAADEAAGPEAVSLAIGVPALEEARAEFEAAAGRPVPVDAFVGQACADLAIAAATPPGQPPCEGGAVVAAERLPTGEGEHLVVRLRVPGGSWLRVAAPFAYYPSVPPSDLPAFPAAMAERLLEAEEEAFARALAALPASSTWRTQLWLALLEQVPPAAVVRAVSEDVLARAVHRTPAFAPLLAALGEQHLLDPRRVFLPAEAAAWAAAPPEGLSPERRAVALALQARGLVEPWSVRLFCEARDADTGVVDTARPVVRELVVEPLRRALVAGVPEPPAVLKLLRGLEGAGGAEVVGQVLDAMLAEGATAPIELGAMARRLPASEARWLGQVSAGSLAGSWLVAHA